MMKCVQFETVADVPEPEPEPELVDLDQGQCADDDSGIAGYFADAAQGYQLANCNRTVAMLGGCGADILIYDDQVSFQWKNPDFLLRNPVFLLKMSIF